MAESGQPHDATASAGSDQVPVPPAVASFPTWSGFQVAVSKFEVFDAATEEWGVYQERLEQFFVANGIHPENKNGSALFYCIHVVSKPIPSSA